MKALALLVLIFGLSWRLPAQPTNVPHIKPGRRDAQFQLSAPYSSGDEIRRRFHIQARVRAYDILKERFEIIVPQGYSPQTNWGLFVWVSPSDSPRIPEEWAATLDRRGFLFIGAYGGGNERDALDRFRLAVDASLNMRQRFRVDPKRIYVSGFSGGGRVASMLGVGYADIFTGTIPICGVNFYAPVSTAEGQTFEGSYTSDPVLAALARKNNRFALVTGEADPNRTSTLAICEQGFKKFGFDHVLYLEVPGMGHAMPSGEWLEKALDFLAPQAQGRK